MGCHEPQFMTIDLGRDDVARALVSDENQEWMTSLAGITRVVLVIGDTVIDTEDAEVDNSVIWFTDTVQKNGETLAVISFRLGGLTIPVGTYEDCPLIIYDATNTNGWRHEPSIKVTVRAAAI